MNERKPYKTWSCGAVVIAAIALTAGCSGKQAATDPGGDKGVTAEAPAAEPKPEPVELVFYSEDGSSEETFNAIYGDHLRKKFPHFTIKYIQQKGKGTFLSDQIASKTHFDFYFHSIGYFLNSALPAGILADMSDLIKKHNVDLSRFEPAVIDGFRSDAVGKLYALPIYTNNMITYYNKDLFNKFGVDYPTNGMTWDSFYELAKKITRQEGGVQYIGYAPMMQYLFYMNPLSIPSLDKTTLKPTINSNEQWKLFFQKLVVAPGEIAPDSREFLPKKAIDVLEGFAKGTQGMAVYVPTLMLSWQDRLKAVNFDIVSSPTFKELPGVGSQPYSTYLGITNMAKNKDAAMEALKYLVSDEVQTTMARQGQLTVLRDAKVREALGKDTAFKNVNWSSVFSNKFAPVPYRGPYATAVENSYTSYATAVMLGEMDMNTAFRKAEEDANKIIQDIKATIP